jgi:hypothetical protein
MQAVIGEKRRRLPLSVKKAAMPIQHPQSKRAYKRLSFINKSAGIISYMPYSLQIDSSLLLDLPAYTIS